MNSLENTTHQLHGFDPANPYDLSDKSRKRIFVSEKDSTNRKRILHYSGISCRPGKKRKGDIKPGALNASN